MYAIRSYYDWFYCKSGCGVGGGFVGNIGTDCVVTDWRHKIGISYNTQTSHELVSNIEGGKPRKRSGLRIDILNLCMWRPLMAP